MDTAIDQGGVTNREFAASSEMRNEPHADAAQIAPARAQAGTLKLLALDPGPKETGFVWYDGARVIGSGVMANEGVLLMLRTSWLWRLAIEMIASYGMPVGAEVFETCVWIGRFIEASRMGRRVELIYRKDVKLHLCGSPRAKDPNVRQALIDKVGAQGTKKAPGPTYGVKSHAWAALAVAVTALETVSWP